MGNPQVMPQENSLVRVTRFISPEYIRKYLRTEQATNGRPIYEDAPKDDKILEWLNNNTLCKLREPFPEHFHSDWGYLLQGQEGVLCIINPEHNQLTTPNIYRPATLNYQWQLTIKSQPKDRPIPRELRSALDDMRFKEVEKFESNPRKY